LRRADLARHRVAGVQVELPDLGGGYVDVVGPGEVVVIGGAEEAEAVGQHFEHALGEDEAALLGPRLQDLEDQLLLAHAGRARHVELLGDLRERPDAHVLERREIDALYLFRRAAAAVPGTSPGGLVGGCRRGSASALLGLLRRGLFTSLSISFHSSSNPSPVAAETGSTESSNTDSSCPIARIRSPRASLSIFVATTAGRATVRFSHVHAFTSLSRPGCLASTSRSAATSGARTAVARSSNPTDPPRAKP